MKRIAAAVLGLALIASAPLAFAGEWTGLISKKDNKVWFTSGKEIYTVSNADKTKGFEGMNVKVNGAADQATHTLTIKTIAKA